MKGQRVKMIKYKYMSEIEIINTILYAFKFFQNKEKRKKIFNEKPIIK